MECDWKPQAHYQSPWQRTLVMRDENLNIHDSCCQTVSSAHVSTVAVDRSITWLRQ